MIAFPATFAALVAALLIDRIFGDPRRLWSRLHHPVVLMGGLVGGLDRRHNDPARSFRSRRIRGILALAALIAIGTAIGSILHALLRCVPLGVLLEAAAVSMLLAQKSLIDHVRAVAEGLERRGLQGGRDAVAMIVGRDVAVLDEAGVSRAAIESAAENFSDGLVAPVFWYALLGLPGLLVYKLANTADSMIGHRTERHEAFGWAAARFDDALNFVPARISAVLIALAAMPLHRRGGAALRTAWRDAPGHKSPNAGWPEAAAAGALGLALGGPRRYGEMVVDGAWLNALGRREADAGDIRAAIRLVDGAWTILTASVALSALWIAL